MREIFTATSTCLLCGVCIERAEMPLLFSLVIEIAALTTRLSLNGAPRAGSGLVENYARLYDIDAFNVILARPAPRVLLGSLQTASPFGPAISFSSVKAILRQVATNVDHHAMRIKGMARARVDAPATIRRFKFGHVPEIAAHDGDLKADQTGSTSLVIAVIPLCRYGHRVRRPRSYLGARA
jgi:hypothetical protein